MKLFRVLHQREIATPVLALLFASAVCVALVFTRIIVAGNLGYGFLAWNLFLAWLPLVFAVWLQEKYIHGERSGWRLAVPGLAWLLFFPNAPYIFTDLIHLTSRFHEHFWVDMMLILMCAVTGLMLGFVSLYLMQSMVTGLFGRVTGWLFILVVAGLSGIGVFVGRFLRLNSWDILLRPAKFYDHLDAWLAHPFADALPYVFPPLFAIFLLVAYLIFYTLTQLPRVAQDSEPHEI